MALILDIQQSSGVLVSYHKIGNYFYERVSGKLEFFVYSYLTKEARIDGKVQATPPKYYVDIAPEAEEVGLLEYMYDYLKNHPDWTGAVDDL